MGKGRGCGGEETGESLEVCGERQKVEITRKEQTDTPAASDLLFHRGAIPSEKRRSGNSLAALFISVGMLTSALTENQIMSAVVCFVIILVFERMASIAESLSSIFKSFLKITHLFGLSEGSIYNAGEAIRSGISWLDPYSKTSCYTSGVFKIVPIIYCLSFAALFMFITYRVLEKKRWSQS